MWSDHSRRQSGKSGLRPPSPGGREWLGHLLTPDSPAPVHRLVRSFSWLPQSHGATDPQAAESQAAEPQATERDSSRAADDSHAAILHQGFAQV